MKRGVTIVVGKTCWQEQVFYIFAIDTEHVTACAFDKAEDNFDAYCIYEYLLLREHQKSGETRIFEFYKNLSRIHKRRISNSVLVEIKRRRVVMTSVDIARHGGTLVLDCFKD